MRLPWWGGKAAGTRAVEGVCSRQSAICLPRLPHSRLCPDEHRSSTQPNEWSCDEPPQGMRCKQSFVCALHSEPTFGQAGGKALSIHLFRGQAGPAMDGQTDICRGLHAGTFSFWPACPFDRDSRLLLSPGRVCATVGPADCRRGIGINCSICRGLERAYEAGLNEYAGARSSAYFGVCTKLAAQKNVDMERARQELEEHRALCVFAVRVFARLPERDASKSLRRLAA